MLIDEQALEIAARAAFLRFRRIDKGNSWDRAKPKVRQDFIDEQRAALEALEAAGYRITSP